MKRPRKERLWPALFALLLLSCGGVPRDGSAVGGDARPRAPSPSPTPVVVVTPQPSPSATPAPAEPRLPARPFKRARALYAEMNEAERTNFLLRRARLIAIKISGEPYQFTDGAIRYVREYVDAYLTRTNNGVSTGWGKDLNKVFASGQKYAPCINRAFQRRNVSPVVGLYIVAIETEFTNISAENDAGAAGLFQFIPSTARTYDVNPSDRVNVKLMADAAARYMAHRINEFGSDPMSVALAIAAYNRSPDSIRRDLDEVLGAPGLERERSFWTLITNSGKLDKYFQQENVKYVPKFFAIAIIGETPWAFNLDMKQALSTYESSSAQCPTR